MSTTLLTPRLRLRPLNASDTPQIVALHTDPAVLRYLGRPVDIDTVRREHLPRLLRVDPHSGRPDYLAAETRDDARVVGWFMLRRVDEESLLRAGPDEGALELGYRLERAAWGRGYATEGGRALVEDAFTTLGADRVVATTMAVNTASRRVLEKCGLRLVRTFFPAWDDPLDGAEHGDVAYALSRHEWARTGAGCAHHPTA